MLCALMSGVIIGTDAQDGMLIGLAICYSCYILKLCVKYIWNEYIVWRIIFGLNFAYVKCVFDKISVCGVGLIYGYVVIMG